MNVENISALYAEVLMSGTSQISCTKVSAIYNRVISHDQFTRLLASGYMNEKYLWQKAKPLCQEIRNAHALLIVDESVESKPYTDENELIGWYYDHSVGKAVKGVCFLTALYHSNEMSVPMGVEFVTKTKSAANGKSKNTKNKNELFRKLVGHALDNLEV